MKLDQSYARFHRELSELLYMLIREGETLWLGNEGHTIKPDHEKNVYNQAVYLVRSLRPYQKKLETLASVQQEVMVATGSSKPYIGILLPTVLTQVTRIRLHTSQAWVTERLDKGKLLKRFNTIVASAEKNLEAFEAHRSPVDSAYERLGAEVEAAKAARERVREAPEQDYRYRTAQTLRKPYFYYGQHQQGSIYVSKHGLIAAGERIVVERNPPYRRARRDTVEAPMVFESRYNRIYRERDWQRAKEFRANPF